MRVLSRTSLEHEFKRSEPDWEMLCYHDRPVETQYSCLARV